MENLVHGVCHLLFLPGRNAFVGLGHSLVLKPRDRKGEGVTLTQESWVLKIPYNLRKNKDSRGEEFPGLNPSALRWWLRISLSSPDLQILPAPQPKWWPQIRERPKENTWFRTHGCFFLSLLISVNGHNAIHQAQNVEFIPDSSFLSKPFQTLSALSLKYILNPSPFSPPP